MGVENKLISTYPLMHTHRETMRRLLVLVTVVHANAFMVRPVSMLCDDPMRWVPTYVMGGEPRVALDVECGIGDSTLEMSQRLSSSKQWTVLGLDADPNRIALAKRKHPSLTFWEGDLSRFPAASVDKVQVHAGRMLHVDDKWAFAGELVRVLRPGGTLDLFDFTLSHTLIHELFHMEETLREQYFCGWSSYDPAWHRHLLAKRRLQFQQTVLLPEKKIVHTTFVK